MSFVLFLATAIGIGFFAQVTKGRPGAGWGFLAAVVWFAVFALGLVAVDMNTPGPSDHVMQKYWSAAAMFATIASGAGMALVVATLPSKKGGAGSTSAPTTSDKKCPFCAETIKEEAIVCRFCGRDLPATALDATPKVVWPDQDLEAKVGIFVAKVALILVVAYVVFVLFGDTKLFGS